MGGKSKDIFLKNARIQKEQLQLCKIEQELEKILGTVNEAINELKVEELQLKAGAAAALSENYRIASQGGQYVPEQPSTSSSASLSLAQLPHDKDDDVQFDAVVNRQSIDLDMLSKEHNVEEEDDE